MIRVVSTLILQGRKWFRVTSLFRATANKARIAVMTANIRNRDQAEEGEEVNE